MIGTTFKLGFDGSSVSKGLGTVTRQLGRFGKEVGIGMARQVGARVTDLMGRIVTAIPESLKETTDWAGNIMDMANATGTSVEKLVLLEEQFRLSGVAAADSAAMMSKMAANIQDAANNGGPAADALAKIGLNAQELKGMALDKQFEAIGNALAALNGTTKTTVKFTDPFGPKFGEQIIENTHRLENMESITADIFGGKMGYKLLRLFNDYGASVAQAKNNVGDLATALNQGGAAAIDTWGDALGRFETFKRSLGTIAIGEIMRATGGAGGVDRMFNFLNPEKIRPQIESLVSTLGRNLEVLLSQDLTTSLGDFMKNLGREFGKGIRDSFSIKDLLGFSAAAPVSGAPSGEAEGGLSGLLRETNTILGTIKERVGIAKFF